MSRSARGKVVVVGIDGVPCTLVRRLAREGVMPNLARMIEGGTLCGMTASIPEVSSTSWSTFMTAVNPGRHGIYGFVELRPGGYGWKFPNVLDLKSRPIWEIAAEAGKKSVVLNVPSTYPAQPMNGLLVSGFVSLDLKKACYPERLYTYLQGMGYRLDVDTVRSKGSDELAHDITSTFRKRVEAIQHLYDTEEWDLFIATITETDRLHHYFWEALDDVAHPKHGFFIGLYRELDAFIGELFAKAGPETPFVILSDHGFTRIKREVNLNVLLRERGHLSFAKPEPTSFEDMDPQSRAFVLDPSRVYVHLKGRYPRGSVEPREYESLRETLAADFMALRVEGEPVVREVLRREQVYAGGCFEAAPDLVLLPHEGYDLKGSITKQELFSNGVLTGGHTRDNAVFYVNRKVVCAAPNIVDVGTTVLQLLGLTAGAVDGRSLV